MVDTSNVWLPIMERYKNSVIQIICVRARYNPFRPQNPPTDHKVSGSGFIVDIERGLLLTNAHVVSNAISIAGRIDRFGERDLSLKLVSICREKDIALCQLSKNDADLILKDTSPGQINMVFADSLLSKEADIVASLGFPLSHRNLKITSGIISGFHANTDDEDEDGTKLTEEETPSYIQITAPLNEGQSGSPLLNQRGEVIGVNAAGYTFQQLIGYAIPSRTVLGIYNELLRPLRDTSINAPYVVITPKYAFEYNRASDDLLELACKQSGVEGIYVKRVYPNSCFDNLQEGDIISQIMYTDIYQNNPAAFNVLNRQEFGGTPVLASLDKYGDVSFPESERKISIKELFDMIPIGQDITIHICRAADGACDVTQGNCGIYAITTQFMSIPSTIRNPIYPRITPYKYEIVAGMSIGELTINHINREENLNNYAKGKKRYEPVLVVNQIFPDTTAYHTRVFKEGSIISQVNGKKMASIEDLRRVLCESTDYLIFVGKDHDKFVVKKEVAIQEDLAALEQFDLTAYKYIFKWNRG